MTAELAAVDHGSTLALAPDQSRFTEEQVAALRHIGVDGAGDGDLMVFHHVCQRTGLDPFARQIHMLSRRVREEVNGEWQWVSKQTIQTGIDGFRLIGRRAANLSGHKVAVSEPRWAHEDGSWREVWMNSWGYPVAAKVTVYRDGEPFPAVAMFDEYKQTKRDGSLTRMWEQRRAGQLAKCAEALAWRMAFPQDLSGIYSDEEMGQADNPPHQTEARQQSGNLADALAETVTAEQVETPAPESPLLNTSGGLAKSMFKAMGDLGVTIREDRLDFASDVIGRRITSSSEMTDADAEKVLAFAQERLAAINAAEGETES